MNAANKDFHLSAWSPAVDRGINIGLTFDFDGNTRPQGLGFDMGVYESPYAQQPLPTSTNTPTATPTPTPLPRAEFTGSFKLWESVNHAPNL